MSTKDKRARSGMGFVLMLCLLFLLGSCSRHEPKVGLFIYNGRDPFIQTFAVQILAKANVVFDTRSFDADNSQLIQNEQLEKFLSEKPALLMINPVDRLGAFAIVRRMQREHVPVIFFNREPLAEDLDLWGKTYYVGARAEQSGQLQAQLVMDLFGGDPRKLNAYDRNGDGVIQTIILKGEQGHQDAEMRTSEVLRSFEKNNFRIEVLALEVANWNGDEAYTKMGRLLANFQGRIELIVSNNDDMALGAIRRLRQAGLFRDSNGNGRIDRQDANWIPVVGIDGLKKAEDSIAEGYLYGTVKNDSNSMAEAMVELSSVLLGLRDWPSLSFPLQEGKYIWIDYRPYISPD